MDEAAVTGTGGQTPALVEVGNLTYDYPTRRALDGITFTVEPGSVVALVGPNGSGKTTLMRCIAGLEGVFAGRIRIDGLDVLRHPRAVQTRIGFLPDHFGLYERLSAHRCLLYWAAAHGIPRAERKERVRWASEAVGLGDRLEVRAGELSRGQRQRLALAQSILHRPRLLLADEPASGLDPEARSGLAALMRGLCQEGMTILVSSHILAELQDYSTHMLILRDGRLVDMARLTDATAGRRRLRVRLAAPHDGLLGLLAQDAGVSDPVAADDGAVFAFAGGPAEQAELLRRLTLAGAPVSAFHEEGGPDLQAAYLRRVRGVRGAA